MKIKSYKKGNKTHYKFSIYLGTDDLGREIRTNRQGFKTKKDAQVEYLRLKEEGLEDKKNITFDKAYEEWLKTYKLTVRTSTLFNTTGLYRNHIKDSLGNRKIGTLTPQDIQTFINSISSKIKGTSKIKSIIKNVLETQVHNGNLEQNPATSIILPKLKKPDKKEEENFYTKEELKTFLELAKDQMPFKYYVFFHLLSFTGMRRGEALALLKSDIDFENKRISITKTLTRDSTGGKIINDTKTSEGNRVIDIDDTTLSLLKDLSKENENPILFQDSNKNYIHLSTPIKYLNKLVKNNDLKRITVHGFRHTHCSLLFEAGATLKEVQHRLGHKDIQTTLNIYTHLTKNQKIQTVDKFINFLEK